MAAEDARKSSFPRLARNEVEAVLALIGDEEFDPRTERGLTLANARYNLRRMLAHTEPRSLIGRDLALTREVASRLQSDLNADYAATDLGEDRRGASFDVEHVHPDDPAGVVRVMRVSVKMLRVEDRRPGSEAHDAR